MISHHLQSIYSKKERKSEIQKLLNLARVVFVFFKIFLMIYHAKLLLI